jgi:hypothetical protein
MVIIMMVTVIMMESCSKDFSQRNGHGGFVSEVDPGC